MSKAIKTLMKNKALGTFIFDAVFFADHNMNVVLTRHPVQSGAAVTDHAYVEPETVTLDIGMTDSAKPLKKFGDNRSVTAYSLLKKAMEKRQPVTLVTRLFTYKDMVVTVISATDDYTTMNALRATITLQKINIVKVSKVTLRGGGGTTPRGKPTTAATQVSTVNGKQLTMNS